jgi:ACS family pantothenate transporter-like MFS transporter
VAGIAMSWAHEICTADMEERALVTGSMNQLAYLFQIWVPLLAWRQVEQPKYTKGFALATILNVGLVIMTFITLYFYNRDKAR